MKYSTAARGGISLIPRTAAVHNPALWHRVGAGFGLAAGLAAAQRLNDHHLVGGAQWMRQIVHLFAVDEDADVPPYPVLFVDHAEANAGVAVVQIGENGGERRATGLRFAALGVRA